MITLSPQPLTADDFRLYGDIIELETATRLSINQGLTTRFHDLVNIDVNEQGGKPIVSVFRTLPLPLPHRVEVMERHPLGSQAFIPMDQEPFLVLVAAPGELPLAKQLRLFITNGRQGVNFHKNTWHHFQIVLGRQRDFIVVDRGGDGMNMQEVAIDEEVEIPEVVISARED